MKSYALIGLLLIAAAIVQVRAAAPANDNFSNAVPLTPVAGSVSITTTNADATKEAGEPDHAGNAGGKSVWFSFTPQSTTVVRINTMDVAVDTLLAVYSGSGVANLTRIGYNDDCNTSCGQASTVDLMLTGGVTYYIAVDGFNNGGSAGSGLFRIALLVLDTPLNDNLAASYDLGFSARGSVAGTNFNATLEPGEPFAHTSQNPNPKTVWYRWTASGSFSAAFEVTDSFDSQIAVFTSNVGNPTFAQLTKVTSNYDENGYTNNRYRAIVAAESGRTYYIKIDWHDFSAQNQVGNFQLRFEPNRLGYYLTESAQNKRAGIAVFRPGDGVWYRLTNHFDQTPVYAKFGLAGDTPIAADVDGDGVTNRIAVRDSGGSKFWYVSFGGSSFSVTQWGLATDKAAVGDFDLDGRADLVAIRDNGQNLVWYVRRSSDGALRVFTFGVPGDKPVFGDFDGDGGTDVAVVRNNAGAAVWHILKSHGGIYDQYSSQQFGLATDLPATQDFDGDGISDPAVFRPSNGTWYIVRSANGQLQVTPFGLGGDVPQPADYDGDGMSDLAVYRPSEGRWYLWFSGNNSQKSIKWGTSADIPVAAAIP